MSHIDIEYENFKVYLSLSDKSILVSVLNIINYDLYSIEIDQLIFNNYNLFVLLISGFKKFNPDIDVKLEVIDKKLNMILNIKNENTNFFELEKVDNKNLNIMNNYNNINDGLDKIYDRAMKIPNKNKYLDVIYVLDTELTKEVIDGFNINNFNKKYYFEITNKNLINVLHYYKGAKVKRGNYPVDGKNGLNLFWKECIAFQPGIYNAGNGCPGWFANSNNLVFSEGNMYELEGELKRLLNSKKINIINGNKKWYITFLQLPNMT